MKPVVIVIGGTDSSAGAGLSRDIATLTELGCEARPVVTAVTAQTDSAVLAVKPVPPEMVAQQLSAALSTGNVAAIKTGMLHSAGTVEAIATRLRDVAGIRLVIDPVLASSSGAALLDAEGIDTLKNSLLPLSTLVTPNLPEAALLTGHKSRQEQADSLLALGPDAVLIKGGHGSGQKSTDWLFRNNRPAQEFTAPRLSATQRGTGCMLASAIAAQLGAGEKMICACMKAKEFVAQKFQQISTANRLTQS